MSGGGGNQPVAPPPIPAPEPQIIVSTLAGSGVEGYLDGASDEAQFIATSALTVDQLGNVYVADTDAQRIRLIASNGNVTTLAGNGPASGDAEASDEGPLNIARFADPISVAVNATGTVYVSDAANYKIRQILDGMVSTLAGAADNLPGFVNDVGAAAKFGSPHGLALDDIGNLYVADTANHAIRKVTPDGVVTTVAGNGTAGDTNGFTTDAQFNEPWDVALDRTGNIYVAERAGNRIRKITPDGTVSTLAGNGEAGLTDGASEIAQFNTPLGLAADMQGNVYVADAINHRIRKITPDGTVSTFAGGGATGADQGGFANGAVGNARFNYPVDVAFDTLGNLYVADGLNYRIRKIVMD
jgi:sugar lactone lactonase YvrE